ncbi:MAG TPA: pilus assembly PilX N-terminal domain-containing protein, partial [Mycobacteriales bacterium]|nr:pilus assembly PilX N-terminal domain-containing protein [Mycobacteriales bacterium]
MSGIRRRLYEEERGIALVTAMMMTMVVLTLSVVMVNLAIHNSTSSAQDRARVQAVHAAEAGVDVVYSQMRQYGYASLPCTQDNDLTTTPVEHYHVVVQYYAVYPPSGNALACPLTQSPAGAVITSTGSAPGANVSVPASRIMQSEVRMSLITGTASFLGTVYGQTGVTMNNTITLNGNQGNDASVYTGGTWTCSNSGSVAGSVYATAVSQSGPTCTVNQDVWANGSISAASLIVGHDMTSSTSSISLSGSSHVTHNATSGTTCTGCSTRVSGTVTTNHTSPPPPIPTFPTINYNAAD